MNVNRKIEEPIANIGWSIDGKICDNISKFVVIGLLHHVINGVNKGGGNSCREFIATLK